MPARPASSFASATVYAPATDRGASTRTTPDVVSSRAASQASSQPPALRRKSLTSTIRRADAAIRLGRNKDAQAVPHLTQTLRSDSSPAVREAAARGLGLIGAPASLSALQNAAQADDDRDVRRSASFAAEIIRANLGR